MPKRIFVRGPNWVGDVVMATPALVALRDHFPHAEIHVGLRPYALPVLGSVDFVDVVHPLDGRGVSGVLRTAAFLRKLQFDLAILFTNSFGTGLETFLSGIKRRRGYGGDGRRLLLNEPLTPLMDGRKRRPIPMAEFYFRLIEGLGCQMDSPHYVLGVSPEDEEAAAFWLEHHGVEADAPIVGINPGAKFGSSKLWLPDRFSRLADRIVESWGGTVILLGGPGEEGLLNEIEAGMSQPCVNSARSLISLSVLKPMIRRLKLLITTDTGPRAIAQAMKTPTVVLMGPTHPEWTNFNNELATVLRHDVSCGPCHKKICDLDHRCMDRITGDSVFGAAMRVLSP